MSNCAPIGGIAFGGIALCAWYCFGAFALSVIALDAIDCGVIIFHAIAFDDFAFGAITIFAVKIPEVQDEVIQMVHSCCGTAIHDTMRPVF